MNQVELNKQAKLSEHFSLGELTRSKSHPEVYNIPSHVHIENLKRVCVWLEVLRARYNERYVDGEEPIIITSGYRSPDVNRAVGGANSSNHLTGCAVDIRCVGVEQAIRYAAILLDAADDRQEDFDELLIERNRKGRYWVHFAVRPPKEGNRRKTSFINA